MFDPLLIAMAATLGLAAVGWWRAVRLDRLRREAMLIHAASQKAIEEQSLRADRAEAVAKRHADILYNALDGFFVLDEGSRFVDANEAYCRMIGYTLDELRHKKISDVEVARPARPLGASQLGTGLHYIFSTHRHKLGHSIHLESCVNVIREGVSRRLVCFAREITERLRAEEALRKSEEKYRHLVETSRDLIWSVDAEGRWTFVNNAVQWIYGIQPADMIGKCFTEYMSPELAKRDWSAFERIKSGDAAFQYETTHNRADGTPVHLSFNAIVIYDDEGRPNGTTGTATDITHRLQAEQLIRDVNRRFEALVAGMPLGYVVWRLDGTILEWNPAAAQIFNCAEASAIGKRIDELIVAPQAREQFERMRARLIASGGGSGLVLENTRGGEDGFRCEWINTFIQHPRAGEPCIATMLRDISEKERMEEQLRQAQKLEGLGVMAGGIAHDFNNLLVGIMGNASIALEHAAERDTVERHLQKVINACQRASGLTQRLLAYAGRAERQPQPMNLNALVTEIVDFGRSASFRTAEITMDLPDDLPCIEADPAQAHQVVMNLIMNACEAISPQSGRITISTRKEFVSQDHITSRFAASTMSPGEHIVLQVSDNGVGMSEQTMARIFDPFFTTKLAGRGLGLSAILGIMRAHCGAISVDSQIDQGTTFRVYFPVSSSAIAAPPVAGEHGGTLAERQKSPHQTTILVIDDDEVIREVVQTILESRGMRVLIAADGPGGVATFRTHSDEIDAVLLDLNMPGMSGEQVLSRLVEVRSDVRVLVSSGFASDDTIDRLPASRLAGVVHKPYTATALVEKLGAALA